MREVQFYTMCNVTLLLLAGYIALMIISGLYQRFEFKVNSIGVLVALLGVPTALYQHFETTNRNRILSADLYVKSMITNESVRRVQNMLENYTSYCSYDTVPWVKARMRQIALHENIDKEYPAAFYIGDELIRESLILDMSQLSSVKLEHLAIRYDFDEFIKTISRIEFYVRHSGVPFDIFKSDLKPLLTVLFIPLNIMPLPPNAADYRCSFKESSTTYQIVAYIKKYFRSEFELLQKMRDDFLPEYANVRVVTDLGTIPIHKYLQTYKTKGYAHDNYPYWLKGVKKLYRYYCEREDQI